MSAARDKAAEAYSGVVPTPRNEPDAFKRQCFRDGWDAAIAAMPAREVTVQEAARLLLPRAENRTLPFYIVEMPLDIDGNGPATIGENASDMCFQVWRASDLATRSQRRLLSDCVTEWLRALAGDKP